MSQTECETAESGLAKTLNHGSMDLLLIGW